MLIHYRSSFSHSVKWQQCLKALYLTSVVIISPRCNNYPRRRACRRESVPIVFSESSDGAKSELYSPLYILIRGCLSLYIHLTRTRNRPFNSILTNTLLLHQKPKNCRQPKPNRARKTLKFLSESESVFASHTETPDSSWLGWKTFPGSQVHSVCCSLS